MFTPEEKGNAEKFLASIRKRTDPFPENSQLSPVKAHPSPTVKGLRAMLTEAKALLGEVSLSKTPRAKKLKMMRALRLQGDRMDSLCNYICRLEYLPEIKSLLMTAYIVDTADKSLLR